MRRKFLQRKSRLKILMCCLALFVSPPILLRKLRYSSIGVFLSVVSFVLLIPVTSVTLVRMRCVTFIHFFWHIRQKQYILLENASLYPFLPVLDFITPTQIYFKAILGA